MRDPKRIKRICKKLERVWHTVPDWRLGQLVCNVGRGEGFPDPFFMEDTKLEKWLDDVIEKVLENGEGEAK